MRHNIVHFSGDAGALVLCRKTPFLFLLKFERENKSVVSKEGHRKDPARLLNSRPESRGLQPAGAPARPREEEELTPAFQQVSSPLAQLLNIAVEGSDTEVVVLLQ